MRVVQPSPPLSLVRSFGGSLPPDADGKDALVIVIPKHRSSAMFHRSARTLADGRREDLMGSSLKALGQLGTASRYAGARLKFASHPLLDRIAQLSPASRDTARRPAGLGVAGAPAARSDQAISRGIEAARISYG